MRRLAARSWTAISLVALLLRAGEARAQVELGSALSSLAARGEHELPSALRGPNQDLLVLAEYPDPNVGIVARRLARSALNRFVRDNPGVKLFWAPPRKPLLDVADGVIHAGAFRTNTGATGKGVVVGVVDTGVDVTHPDLRTRDGRSRVRYLLDFSRKSAGLQASLEAEYGCDAELGCAIFSGEDLDELIGNGVEGDEPGDTFGHGTHVASLALGNGLGSDPPRYIGVAPEAELIAARVSRTESGAIYDADIVQAVRFVFDRARALRMPAVVNLSLGSDFGPHDGSSALERALARFIGPSEPGRAIVVAAGNSATLYANLPTDTPGPYGVHTEVHVPRGGEVEVPLLTPSAELGGRAGASIYIWLSFRPDDELSLAVDDAEGAWLPFVAPGRSATGRRRGYEGVILNGQSSGDIEVPAENAVAIIEGNVEPGRRFTLRLRGHGSASLWVQSTGGFGPETSAGVLFPRAAKQGTINVPAASDALIAVGATVNRTRFRDYTGAVQDFASDGGRTLEVDTAAIFSSAGPNARGVLKPDLVAPGMLVVGAMAERADPRKNGGFGEFASAGRCGRSPYECFVVDDGHAVASGTSLSAPLVSGAVALLFEHRPELTQEGVRALLQAGARKAAGAPEAVQLGAGVLDLEGTLAALIAEDSPIDRWPSRRSRMELASSYAHPDSAWPLRGLLELRDDDDAIADGFDPRRLELVVHGGELSRQPLRIAAGLYAFEAITRAGTGGQRLGLELRFDGERLVEKSLPIAVDRALAEGHASAEGGCAVTPGQRRAEPGPWLWVCALFAAVRFTCAPNRRCKQRARKGARRDRKDDSDRARPR